MDHLQINDLDITAANAGEQWLELKAVALSRAIYSDKYHHILRASIALNAVLAIATITLLALLFPHLVLTAVAIGAALWLLGVMIFAATVLDCYLREPEE